MQDDREGVTDCLVQTAFPLIARLPSGTLSR